MPEIEDWHRQIEEALPSEKDLEDIFDRLWPICRSLTGNGFRQSLRILSEIAEYESFEVESGTKVFDWTIPREWNIDDAYVENEQGQRIIDFRANNLHVLGYSIPVDTWVTRAELEEHLYSLPEQPDAIPYLTSYYHDRWGFCVTEKQRKAIPEGRYRAVVRSTLRDGHLTYGHKTLGSGTGPELLFSSYLCHPSMANNELSGPIVTSFLCRALRRFDAHRLNYRFVIVPETIGAVAYLSRFGEEMRRDTYAGYVVTCVGDDKRITYKRSRRGTSDADRVALNELSAYGKPFETIDFNPHGSDERQYCSPGFNLPVGSLTRSMYGTYPEYHTSLDNKQFISFSAMRETIRLYLKFALGLQFNETYTTNFPFCEPMLSPRGLYPSLGSQKKTADFVERILWITNLSDGENDLCAIAQKAKCSILDLEPIVRQAVEKGVLRKTVTNPAGRT